MEWDDLLEIVDHRLAAYTGASSYARAHSLIEGFELGRQGSDIMAFQQWMAARRPGSNLPGGPCASWRPWGSRWARESRSIRCLATATSSASPTY